MAKQILFSFLCTYTYLFMIETTCSIISITGHRYSRSINVVRLDMKNIIFLSM